MDGRGAGPAPGENIDLNTQRLHIKQQVQDGRLGPLKDDESRVVPITAELGRLLRACMLKTGGAGLLFPPTWRRGTAAPGVCRRTCGPTCLWVLGGGSIVKLSKIMGHSSVVVTERYAHLRPDLFEASDFLRLGVDLRGGGGVVSQPSEGQGGALGHPEVIDPVSAGDPGAAKCAG